MGQIGQQVELKLQSEIDLLPVAKAPGDSGSYFAPRSDSLRTSIEVGLGGIDATLVSLPHPTVAVVRLNKSPAVHVAFFVAMDVLYFQFLLKDAEGKYGVIKSGTNQMYFETQGKLELKVSAQLATTGYTAVGCHSDAELVSILKGGSRFSDGSNHIKLEDSWFLGVVKSRVINFEARPDTNVLVFHNDVIIPVSKIDGKLWIYRPKTRRMDILMSTPPRVGWCTELHCSDEYKDYPKGGYMNANTEADKVISLYDNISHAGGVLRQYEAVIAQIAGRHTFGTQGEPLRKQASAKLIEKAEEYAATLVIDEHALVINTNAYGGLYPNKIVYKGREHGFLKFEMLGNTLPFYLHPLQLYSNAADLPANRRFMVIKGATAEDLVTGSRIRVKQGHGGWYNAVVLKAYDDGYLCSSAPDQLEHRLQHSLMFMPKCYLEFNDIVMPDGVIMELAQYQAQFDALDLDSRADRLRQQTTNQNRVGPFGNVVDTQSISRYWAFPMKDEATGVYEDLVFSITRRRSEPIKVDLVSGSLTIQLPSGVRGSAESFYMYRETTDLATVGGVLSIGSYLNNDVDLIKKNVTHAGAVKSIRILSSVRGVFDMFMKGQQLVRALTLMGIEFNRGADIGTYLQEQIDVLTHARKKVLG